MNFYNILKPLFSGMSIIGIVLFGISLIPILIIMGKQEKKKEKAAAAFSLAAAALCIIGLIGNLTVSFAQSKFDFDRIPSFEIHSDHLVSGQWSDEIADQGDGRNLSPELHWEPVESASMYYVYMIDETADNLLHWQISGTPETHLPAGLCDRARKVIGVDNGREYDGQYIGPHPSSGTHTDTVYVFALKCSPSDVDAAVFGSAPNDIAAIAEDLDKSPFTDYHNIISVGVLSGTYTAKSS